MDGRQDLDRGECQWHGSKFFNGLGSVIRLTEPQNYHTLLVNLPCKRYLTLALWEVSDR